MYLPVGQMFCTLGAAIEVSQIRNPAWLDRNPEAANAAYLRLKTKCFADAQITSEAELLNELIKWCSKGIQVTRKCRKITKVKLKGSFEAAPAAKID